MSSTPLNKIPFVIIYTIIFQIVTYDVTCFRSHRAYRPIISSPISATAFSARKCFLLRLFCMSKAGSQYAKRLTCGNCGKETYVNPVHVPWTTLRHSNCVWSDLKKRWDRVSTWSCALWKGEGMGTVTGMSRPLARPDPCYLLARK